MFASREAIIIEVICSVETTRTPVPVAEMCIHDCSLFGHRHQLVRLRPSTHSPATHGLAKPLGLPTAFLVNSLESQCVKRCEAALPDFVPFPGSLPKPLATLHRRMTSFTCQLIQLDVD